MKKLILLFLLSTAASYAADVHFTWLLAFNTVPGLPLPSAPQFGAQVFMDSDDPNVTEFQIKLVVQMSNGDIVTKNGTAVRDGKTASVLYSTSYTAWFGSDAGFQVLSLQVNAVVGKRVTKPFPGKDYSSSTATVSDAAPANQ